MMLFMSCKTHRNRSRLMFLMVRVLLLSLFIILVVYLRAYIFCNHDRWILFIITCQLSRLNSWPIYHSDPCHFLISVSHLINIFVVVVVVARAIVPKMNLDELFEQKGEVAKGVMEELGKVIFTAFIKSC